MRFHQQRELYNERYDLDHQDTVSFSHQSLLFLKWMARNLPPNPQNPPRLLDLGGGLGQLGRELQHSDLLHGYRYINLDMSDKAAQLSHRHGTGEFVRGVIPETGYLPFADNSFDLVHCSHVVEHLINPDIVFTESHRILAPGGVLFVATPNLASWIGRFMVLCGWQGYGQEISTVHGLAGKGPLGRLTYGKGGINYHLRVFTLSGLKDMMRLHGFTILKCQGAQLIGGGSGSGLGKCLVTAAATTDRVASAFPSIATNILCFGQKPHE